MIQSCFSGRSEQGQGRLCVRLSWAVARLFCGFQGWFDKFKGLRGRQKGLFWPVKRQKARFIKEGGL